MCGSRKNPCPPHGRSPRILRGRGVLKTKILDPNYEFPGGRGVQTKNFPWGEYGYFLVHSLVSVLNQTKEDCSDFYCILKTMNSCFLCGSGIYQYRAQISSFRLLILSCMTELSVDVLKISKHPNEGSIKVRWRIKGIPLIRKFLPYIGRRLREGEDCYR